MLAPQCPRSCGGISEAGARASMLQRGRCMVVRAAGETLQLNCKALCSGHAGRHTRPRTAGAAPWAAAPVSRIPWKWTGSCTASTGVSVSAPPLQSMTSSADSADSAAGIPVSMCVQYESSFGEVLKVVGSSPALGLWEVAGAPIMTWNPGHEWRLDLLLEPGQLVEYKLVRQTGNGVTWEGGPNRQLRVPKRLLLDDEEFGGTTLITANLVWGDVAASSVQIVVQQPSLSSVDVPLSSVDASRSPVDFPTATAPPPATAAPPKPPGAVPSPAAPVPEAATQAGELPRGSRFQANFSRTPLPNRPAQDGESTVPDQGSQSEPPLVILPEPKPVKFRFKRLGSFDELQEQLQPPSPEDRLPDMSEFQDPPVLPTTSASQSAPITSISPTISSPPSPASTASPSAYSTSNPAATAPAPEADPSITSPEIKETPVSFRFRRVSSQDEDSATSSDDEASSAVDLQSKASETRAENTTAGAVEGAVASAGPVAENPTASNSGTLPESAQVKEEAAPARTAEAATGKATNGTASTEANAVQKNVAKSGDAVPGSANAQAKAEASGEAKDERTSGVSAEVVSALNSLMEDNQSISGAQLRQAVFSKWKRHYDVQLSKLNGRMYFQVMWKFLEQQSFPMTEEQYDEKLDAIAYCISEWGVVDIVLSGIEKARGHPGHTTGGGARAVSIPLGVDLDGRRKQEFSSSRR